MKPPLRSNQVAGLLIMMRSYSTGGEPYYIFISIISINESGWKMIAVKNGMGFLLFCSVSVTAAPAAEKFEMSTRTMMCGNAQFKIESTCARSREEMTLNTCRPQVLTIVSNGKTVQKTLPELNKADVKRHREAGGTLSDLYVTQWGCAGRENARVALIYYSAGGGNAAYSESMAFYDAAGNLIQKSRDPRYAKAIADGMGKLVPVPSIMPTEGP
jgi:hypothetical protein